MTIRKFRNILFILIILLPTITYSQFFAKLNYGMLDTNRVSLNLFRMQKVELNVYNGMKIDSAQVYFQIPSEKGIIIVDFIPKLDTVKFQKCLKLLTPGSIVSFENIILTDKKNFKFQIHNLINYIIIPEGNINGKQSDSFLELKRLSKLEFTSGTIYFTGGNFRNPIVLKIEKTNLNSVKNYFGMTTIGSKIIFENVFYSNEKNETLGPLNKIIILD